MKLIVGLGNIGAQYAKNRHNAGFILLDERAKQRKAPDWIEKTKLKAWVTEIEIKGERVILAKPTTMMNRSGEAISLISKFYKIPIRDILVVADDWALPIGCLRLRLTGGHGGHNGLRNIIEVLGTPDFVRGRIGVRPIGVDEKEDPLKWVLQDFSEEEVRVLKEEVLPEGLAAAHGWLEMIKNRG